MPKQTKKESFFTYKGKPLVRKGNLMYYGHMYEKAVAMLTVQSTCELGGLQAADKVQVQLISTDPSAPPQEMVIKNSTQKGLYASLDLANIWIDRFCKTA